jgi:hypothetical protein
LFKPVLRVFQKTETLKELLPVISNYVSRRRQTNANSFHAFLYKIVKELINVKESYELESSDIWLFVVSNLEGSPITGKPLSYDSSDFDIISQKMVTQILKDVFGAIPTKSHGSSRRLIFEPDKLKKIGSVYELDVDVKIAEEDDDIGTDRTVGTETGRAGLDKHL